MMMTIIKEYLKEGMTLIKDNVLFLMIAMLFLPDYLLYPSLLICGVFVTYEYIKYKAFRWSFFWVLWIYLVIVSWVSGNWFGLGACVVLLFINGYAFSIHRRITPLTYMKLQYYIVWSSLFNFFFNFIQYKPAWFKSLMATVESMLNIDHLPSWHLPPYGNGYYRAYSTFDNPNFYAFILMIVLLVCFNQIQFQLTFKNYSLGMFYIAAFIINMYALFLTETRAIVVALLVGLVVIIFIQRKWLQLKVLMLLGSIAAIFILTNPTLFPRFMQITEHTSIRLNIWETALMQIEKEPWFGKGLFTYAFLFDNTHAHNIFIESLLSFGVAGTAILLAWFTERMQTIYKTGYYLDYPLAFAVLIATITYGVMDIPLLYVQTSFLLVAIFCLPDRNIETKVLENSEEKESS